VTIHDERIAVSDIGGYPAAPLAAAGAIA